MPDPRAEGLITVTVLASIFPISPGKLLLIRAAAQEGLTGAPNDLASHSASKVRAISVVTMLNGAARRSETGWRARRCAAYFSRAACQ
jgi:hypothetical protein